MDVEKFYKSIEHNRLIEEGDHVILGLSGGPDSVCLFFLLVKLQESLDFRLHCVHVNHGFRGEAADDDQLFVERICKEAGVECTSVKVDCRGYAKLHGMTEEEAGREVRYEAFINLAKALPVEPHKVKLAVAHNRDDQAETVLFRILRGTGINGLGAMEMCSNVEDGYRIIRPLLNVWRKEIDELVETENLPYSTDHTNAETKYTRNRLRLEAIPYLESFNPKVKDAIVRLGEYARESEAALEDIASEHAMNIEAGGGKAWIDTCVLGSLSKAVAKRVIMDGLKGIGLIDNWRSVHINSILEMVDDEKGSGYLNLPHGVLVIRTYGRLEIWSEAGLKALQARKWSLIIGEVDGTDESFQQRANAIYIDRNQWHHLISCNCEPVLRTRERGDYMEIFGVGRKSLKNIMIDDKIPAVLRDNIPLLAMGSKILWLPKLRVGNNKERVASELAMKEADMRLCRQLISIEIIDDL